MELKNLNMGVLESRYRRKKLLGCVSVHKLWVSRKLLMKENVEFKRGKEDIGRKET